MIDLDAWRERCVVAYIDEPPFFSPVPGQPPVGCDIELTTIVLAALGVDEVAFVLTTFGELIAGVRERRWHVNTPIFITDERARLVRYSRPVWVAVDSFIVRATDVRDFTSYEAIANDETIRLAGVSGQIQLATALGAGVPSERILEFTDQDSAVRAVLAGEADASVSTAPGNSAYVDRLGNPRLVAVVDSGANDRGELALGAFSFAHDSADLAEAFDEQLGRTLGTPDHLAMMGRHGFDALALQPILDR